jgi:hypothetical protein
MIIPFVGKLPAHACLNHAAIADSISSRSQYINNFCYLEKTPDWMLTSFNGFTLFHNSVLCGQWSLNCDASSTCIPICASTFATISTLLLNVNDFCFFYQYFTSCYEIMLSPQYNFIYKTDHSFPSYG